VNTNCLEAIALNFAAQIHCRSEILPLIPHSRRDSTSGCLFADGGSTGYMLLPALPRHPCPRSNPKKTLLAIHDNHALGCKGQLSLAGIYFLIRIAGRHDSHVRFDNNPFLITPCDLSHHFLDSQQELFGLLCITELESVDQSESSSFVFGCHFGCGLRHV
jgi:hypothetical protein